MAPLQGLEGGASMERAESKVGEVERRRGAIELEETQRLQLASWNGDMKDHSASDDYSNPGDSLENTTPACAKQFQHVQQLYTQ